MPAVCIWRILHTALYDLWKYSRYQRLAHLNIRKITAEHLLELQFRIFAGRKCKAKIKILITDRIGVFIIVLEHPSFWEFHT